MAILRAVALVAVVAFCGGFVPVGGCAKGCGAAGRIASHEADDIARIGARSTFRAGESAAVSGSRYADDLARTGRYGAGVAVGDDLARTGRYGAVGDDLAHAGAGVGDDLAHVADDVHTSRFANELEQSGIKLSESEHDEVLDALTDVTEEVIGQLADGDDSDDEADEQRTAVQLETRLKASLSREQLRAFHAKFGTSKQLVERVAREQAAKRSGGSGRK
jgi:hypothetical protein